MRQKIIGRFRRPDGSVGRFNIECEAAEEGAEQSVRPGQVDCVLPTVPATPDGSPHPAQHESAVPR